MSQDYPNPFNPATNFEFRITEQGPVKLTVLDMLGREVTTLVHGELAPGTYHASWDATDSPSGTYLYRLQTIRGVLTKQMTLVK